LTHIFRALPTCLSFLLVRCSKASNGGFSRLLTCPRYFFLTYLSSLVSLSNDIISRASLHIFFSFVHFDPIIVIISSAKFTFSLFFLDSLHTSITKDQKICPPINKEYNTTPNKVYQNRYPHILFGYFFACSNFEHKVMNCREYGRKKLRVKNYNLKYKKTIDQIKRRNYNSFAPLQEWNLEFLRCNNYGYKASNCRLLEASEKPKFM
jgi:hypothetical protein